MKKLLVGASVAALLYAASLIPHNPTASGHPLLAMPITMGMYKGGISPPPAFSYRNNYDDTSNATNYTFPACDIGTAHILRMVVVGVKLIGGTGVLSMTVNGVAATSVITSGNTARSAELWRAAVPSGTTGITIQVNGNSAATACRIYVWAGYPTSMTPVDTASSNVASASPVLTDLAKTAGGFACFVSGENQSGTTGAMTQNGAETIIEDHEGSLDGAASSAAMSFVVTATTTTNDFTRTWSGSNGRGLVGATWV